MRGKKTIINIITSLIVQIATVVCGFIIPKLIISKYGSNVNGLVTSITQFLSFITLIEAGFGPVIKSILYKPIAQKDKSTIEKILKASEKIFRTISYIFIVYVTILCVTIPFKVATEFNFIYTTSLIIIIAISTFSEYYFGMIYSLYIQAEQRKYVLYNIKILTLIFNAILVIVLIYCNQSIQIVKLASSAVFVLRPIIQNIYVKRKFKINLKDIENDYKIKQKWDGLVQHIAYVVHSNTDIAVLTIFGNLKDVSVYSIYSMITNTISNIMISFSEGVDAAFGDMIARGESENLNKNFKMYEGSYITVSTFIFASTLFLIIPFVYIYTKGITDANYIVSSFAYLFVLAKFIYVLRQPYYDLVKVSGQFKQTRKGAIIEALSNIIVSVLLVLRFGITGVVIGTVIAILYRTIEIMYYTSKHILKRNIWNSFRNIIIIVIEITIIAAIVNYVIPKMTIENYGAWIIYAITVCSISAVVIGLINAALYKDAFCMIYKKIRRRKV